MNKKIYLLIIISFLGNSLIAQKKELGNVTIAELKEKFHPIDSSASAAYLIKKGTTKFLLDNDGYWTLETIVNVKIKIYKKEGLKYANQSVSYYVGGITKEAVSFSNEATYNLVDNKVVKTKLKSEGVFKEEFNENWSVKKITFPDVKEGSIIEYSYRLITPYITNFNDWYFQKEIPVDYVNYDIYIPKYFEYRTIITGYEQIESKSEPIMTSQYGEVKFSFKKNNIPAIKDESFVANIDNYTSILKLELISITYPNKPKENIAITWSDVVKNIYNQSEFGAQLKKDNYFEDDLTALLKDINSNREKINAIFNYVQNRMSWNKKRGIYCNDGVKKAYQEKTGNIAEINLMLTAMLRYAGLNANPIVLSTRDNGIAIFPTRSSFNYVISAVEIDNEIILLDATDKNSLPNVLPIRDLNWNGRIIRKEGSSDEISLIPNFISKEMTNVLVSIKNDGELNGQISKQYSGYNAFDFRDDFQAMSEESYLEKIEKRYNTEISDYKIEGKNDLNINVKETYTFKQNNSVEIIGDKMYFSPLLFLTENLNPFLQEKREYPVDFIFSTHERVIIKIDIPDNYEVESIPKSISMPFIENYLSFKLNISTNDKQIQILAVNEINSTIIPANYYSELKAYFSELIKRENEKIVLKKI
jgi:transglutaminase-like putative cysteine protease